MIRNGTTEAILSVQNAMKYKIHEDIIRMALVAQGFKIEKAEVIIRWAKISMKEGI